MSAAAATIPNRARFTCTPEPLWVVEVPIWCKEVRRVRLTAIAARIMDGRCAYGARVLLPTRWRSAMAERRALLDHPATGGTDDAPAASFVLVFLKVGNTACRTTGS